MEEELYYITEYSSILGDIKISCDGSQNLTGLYFSNQNHYNCTNTKLIEKDNIEIFENTKNWLDKYFKGQKPDIKELPVKLSGSTFRQHIYKILCQIPYGETSTYSEIANKIATETGIQNMSAQAIGNAVGHNPILIIIPCHRVIGKNGSLTGYAAGIEIKRKLLRLETHILF